MAGDNHPRRKVSLILGLCLARHLPPAIVLAQKLRVAASVDDAVAHNADAFGIINTDEWPAPSAGRRWTLGRRKYRRRRARRNRAAKPRGHTLRLYFIQRGIARPEQR